MFHFQKQCFILPSFLLFVTGMFYHGFFFENNYHRMWLKMREEPNLPMLEPSSVNRSNFKAQVLVYNRVPKAGSSFVGSILTGLSKRNDFTCHNWFTNIPGLRPNFFGQKLNLGQQQKFIQFLAKPRMKPFFHGAHYFTLNWTAYESTVKVDLINFVREPVAQFVSLYHYTREGPSSMVGAKWKKLPGSWRKKTLEKCVLEEDSECQIGGSRAPFKDGEVVPLEMQLTYFCGQHEECMNGTSRWALHQAMHMVETKYSVVGILEQMNRSIKVMEAYLPAYFAGATALIINKEKQNVNPHPKQSKQVVEALKDRLHLDIEFYSFVKQRLALQADMLNKDS